MNKKVLILDGDSIAYRCAAAGEQRSIEVTHKPTGIKKSFKHRTEFKKSMEERCKEITDDFYLKLSKMIGRRLLGRWFLPMPIKNALTIFRAAKYIWYGLDSLTSFRVDVALLDGAAVAGALLQNQYQPLLWFSFSSIF